MASLSTDTELTPKLQVFVRKLRGAGLQHLWLDPCSTRRETYRALAIFSDNTQEWYEDSCLSALKQNDDVDLLQELHNFTRKHHLLQSEFKGTVAHAKENPSTLTVEASVGTNSNVLTDEVHFLEGGDIICFSAKMWVPPAQAVLLQRTTFRGAKTFDMEVLDGEKQTCHEVRLVPKSFLKSVETWGVDASMWVFRSPGNPVPTKLLLRAYKDGDDWNTIARALTGEDSSSESESEDEWIPDEGSDSDEDMESESESECEDSDNDPLSCLN